MSYDQILARHCNTFRGKNLGTSFTDEQKEAIRTATFKDLYIGDYWEINGNKWRIADIDYFYGSTYTTNNVATTVNDHHLVIFPDNSLIRIAMDPNPDGLITKGYAGSDFNVNKKSQIESNIYSTFSSNNIMDFGINLTSSKSTFTTLISKIVCPSYSMLFGYNANINNPFNDDANIEIGHCMFPTGIQMSLFRLAPRYIYSFNKEDFNDKYWLSTFYISTKNDKGGFVFVTNTNYLYWDYSNLARGIRPIFCLKG